MDGLLRCRANVQFRVAASHIITTLHSHHLIIPLLRSLARSLAFCTTAAERIRFLMPHYHSVDQPCDPGFYPNHSTWMPSWWTTSPKRGRPMQRHPRLRRRAVDGDADVGEAGDRNKFVCDCDLQSVGILRR